MPTIIKHVTITSGEVTPPSEVYTGRMSVTFGDVYGTGLFPIRSLSLTPSEQELDPIRDTNVLTEYSFTYRTDNYKVFKDKIITFDVEGILGSYDRKFGYGAYVSTVKDCYVRLKDYTGFMTKELDQTIGEGYWLTNGYVCNLTNPPGDYTGRYWRATLEIVPTADNFYIYLSTSMRDNAS